MNVHLLKVWPAEFLAILEGRKRHEFRKNDRQYQLGDHITLREFNPRKPHGDRFSGDEIDVKITHISRGPEFGIPKGWAMMTIQPIMEMTIEIKPPEGGEG